MSHLTILPPTSGPACAARPAARPFLGTDRRATVLEFVDRIVELTKALTKFG